MENVSLKITPNDIVAKGTKIDLMALISTALRSLKYENIITNDDIDFICEVAKKEANADDVEDILKEAIDNMKKAKQTINDLIEEVELL